MGTYVLGFLITSVIEHPGSAYIQLKVIILRPGQNP